MIEDGSEGWTEEVFCYSSAQNIPKSQKSMPLGGLGDSLHSSCIGTSYMPFFSSSAVI